MDYKRNAQFFDDSAAKKAKMLKLIGIGVILLGLIFTIVVFAARLFKMQAVAIVLIIAGFVVFFWGSSLVVKEEELTDELERKEKQVRDVMYEKFNFPPNYDKRSKTFVGCDYTKTPGVTKTLLNKQELSPDCVATEVYFATEGRKIGVFILSRSFSMLSEVQEDTELRLHFEDFDDVGLGHVELEGGKRAAEVCFYKEEQKVLSFPVMNSDYYSEEFFADLLHARKRYLKIR